MISPTSKVGVLLLNGAVASTHESSPIACLRLIGIGIYFGNRTDLAGKVISMHQASDGTLDVGWRKGFSSLQRWSMAGAVVGIADDSEGTGRAQAAQIAITCLPILPSLSLPHWSAASARARSTPRVSG